MSDAPLFQNTDEQEKVYAPQELARGTDGESRATLDDGNRAAGDGTTNGQGPAVPVVAGAVAGGAAGAGAAGGTGGGGNPAIGLAALETSNERESNSGHDN